MALCAAILFVFCFSSLVSAESLPLTFKTTKDQLNIRIAPDTYSSILTVIDEAGTVLYPVERTTSNWYKVRFANNVYGYVYKAYVTPGDAVKSEVKLFSGAALRTAANRTAPVQRLLSVGTEIDLSSADGDWYYAKGYNEEEGYILKSSVKEVSFNYPAVKVPDVAVDSISIVEVTSASVAARSGPKTGSSAVATVKQGMLLTVTSTTREADGYTWYHVVVPGGAQGYLRSDAIKSFDTSYMKGKTIVIDPGKGSLTSETATSINNGNVGVTGTLEKDVNLAVSRYLQAYLNKMGANVVMTRTADAGVMTPADRAAIANNNNADILISVNCNFNQNNSEAKGTSICYFPGNTSTAVSSELLNQRKRLATLLQQNLVQDIASTNLGIQEDTYTVLVRSTMPSVWVRLGYLSNASEEAKLKTSSYQLLCAQGLLKGVLLYFK